MMDAEKLTLEEIARVLGSAKERLPAYVAELRGKPYRDWDGNDVIDIRVVIDDNVIDDVIAQRKTHDIEAELWRAFQDAGIEEVLVTTVASVSEQAELDEEEQEEAAPRRRRG